jgi:hypothetical protein
MSVSVLFHRIGLVAPKVDRIDPAWSVTGPIGRLSTELRRIVLPSTAIRRSGLDHIEHTPARHEGERGIKLGAVRSSR